MFYLSYVAVLITPEHLELAPGESLIRIDCPIFLSMIFVMREVLLVSLNINQLDVHELPPCMF